MEKQLFFTRNMSGKKRRRGEMILITTFNTVDGKRAAITSEPSCGFIKIIIELFLLNYLGGIIAATLLHLI